MSKQKTNKVRNYILIVGGEFYNEFATLREARLHERSIINVNAVRQLDQVVEIYKKTTSLKQISCTNSEENVILDAGQLTKEFAK